MKWRALVLAGERAEGDPLAVAEGAPAKAFIDVAGKPMIAHVLEALTRVPVIHSVAVSLAPTAPALPPGDWQRLDAAEGPSASVMEGLDALGAPLLVTTADHPLLRPETVEAFLEAAEACRADAVAGIAEASVAARIEGAPQRTVMRFRDCGVTGCNLFALLRPEARDVVAFWQRLEALRKRPAALALAVGPVTAARLKAGLLDLAGAEAALARRTGVAVATVRLDDPLAAHDVDTQTHLAFARSAIERK